MKARTLAMADHDYITVLARRWCMGCNTHQTLRRGRWRDVPEMLGPWPGYSPTQEQCVAYRHNHRDESVHKLTTKEIDRLQPHLARFSVCCSAFKLGIIEVVALGEGGEPDRYHWHITPFYAPVPISRHGVGSSSEDCLEQMARAWGDFLEFAQLKSGGLRLVKQKELADGGIDYHVLAGEFRMGRMTEQKQAPTPGWMWSINGILPSSKGVEPKLEDAMRGIKEAWLAICRSTGEMEQASS